MNTIPRPSANSARRWARWWTRPIPRGVVSPVVLDHVARPHAQIQADKLGEALGLPTSEWDRRPPGGVHLREVALRVDYVRLFVDHARLALEGKPTSPAWQRIGAFDEDAMSEQDEAMAVMLGERPLGDESPETVAWARFAGWLNIGLSELSPRILTFHVASEPDPSDVVTAFTAACAQVFNDLRDQLPYKVCADETCGRLFRRQLGRSKGLNKPRSSGVEYCTWAHARNQSRRERRREARGS